ncbi:MAG: APC family permease [Gemmataceae bacterium]
MSSPAAPPESPSAQLGLWDVVSIIVGIIVGATIYRLPAAIFGNVTDQTLEFMRWSVTVPAMWAGLGTWVIVGVLSLIGAMCYAELATAYPSSGGDFYYLTRAYGPGPGFLFAWAEMSIIRTGASIGVMAFVFGEYANELQPLSERFPGVGRHATFAYAAAAVVLLTLVNLLGLRAGKFVQNLLTLVKIIGLLAIIVAGGLYFLWPRKGADVVPADGTPDWPFPPSFALALVLVFYAYGGWNEAAYVAAELRERRRNVIRALVFGVGLVMLIYLAVNGAYVAALGLDRVRASPVVAARVMELPLGGLGAKLISGLIMISCVGAINGLMFTGVRLYSTFGRRERLFAWLSYRGRSFATPPGAVLVQTVLTLALLSLFEFGSLWKPWVADQLGRIHIQVGENFRKPAPSFEDLVACTSPVFWLFFTFTGYSLIVLRGRDRGTERPFRVPLYPILPLVFCASSLWMFYKSTDYALTRGPAELAVVVLFLLLGVPLYALSGPPGANTTTAPD